jgi:hypothetical protein
MLAVNIEQYLYVLATTCKNILSSNFIGAYSVGSYALGGYEEGLSDLDVLIISETPLETKTKQQIVSETSHRKLECPAQKLELVVYSQEHLNNTDSHFEINFNTGKTLSVDHICFDYKREPPHWFLIDKAIAYYHARVIQGQDPKQVFEKVPRDAVSKAVIECLTWHQSNESIAGERNIKGNAARAWMWTEENMWTTKSQAVKWCEERGVRNTNDIMNNAFLSLKQIR